MTHTYTITGMTCGSCEAKVKAMLLQVEEITSAAIDLEKQSATIQMDKHVSLSKLQDILGGKESKYQVSAVAHSEIMEQGKTWFSTYKPILLIFFYITLTTLFVQKNASTFNLELWMSHFMGGFFLVFSFFKWINIKGFANSYRMYDIVAKKVPWWPYVYATVELSLGISFLVGFNPFLTNLITLVVMSISLIGVLQAVLNKRKIQCACLGDVFNLPMSTVTIIEDALMIAMSGWMLLTLII